MLLMFTFAFSEAPMVSCRPARLLGFVAVLALWAAPARAEPQGGIEIGAKGVRAVAVEATDGTVKVLAVENKNTTLVADLAAKKEFAAKSLDETADVVAKFAQKLRSEYKITDKNLYVVGSSGLFAPLAGDDKLIKAAKEQLTAAVQKSAGLPLDFVTVEREAELTVAGVVPKKVRPEAVLLDIGSGNTKGAAEQKGGWVTFGVPYGSVSFTDLVKKEAKTDDFAKTAGRLRTEVVAPKLLESIKGKAELTERKRVYLSGGAVWALATFTKPGDRGDLVELTAADIKAYAKFLAASTGEVPDADVSGVTDAAAKKAALADMAQVRKTFTREQMVAGAELLAALADGFQLDAAGKRLYFPRNAYIGWLLGYVAEKEPVAK